MRRLNSSLSDKSSENWKTPYLDIIAVGTIQFFLSALILCYGVFLMEFVLRDVFNLKTNLWTAITFVAASKITNPWVKSYCKHLDNIRRRVHKRNITVTVILLFGDFVFVSFCNTQIIQIIFYGTFGGIFSSFIYTHLNFATAEAFKHHPQLFNILDQLMKSFCLLFMPHLLLLLINLYGPGQSLLILGAVILNIIPACFLVRTRKHQRVPLCKFQTIDRLSMEMVDLHSKPPVIKEPSSSSSDEDEEDEEEEDSEEHKSEAPPESSTVQRYYQNVGVKILPNIPEENEMEEDDDINEISSKRLSKISAILQELNENNHKDLNLSVNNLYQPDEIIESVEPEDEEFIKDEFTPKKKCFSLSSSTKYNLELKKRRVKSFLYKSFVKSVPRTLSVLYFYPAIISTSITTTLSTIIFATAPYLMFDDENKSKNYPTTPEESTFLLTIIGFTWLFFLAGYPVFNKLSSLKTKILFLVGLSVSGLSLFIVHRFQYDNFVLFSLTFGIGHGIVSYTEYIALEDFFGEAKWKMVKGALETCTGFIVILIYLIIYFSYLEIYVFLSYAYWLYVFDVVLWIVAYTTKRIVFYLRNVRRYNVDRHPDFNF